MHGCAGVVAGLLLHDFCGEGLFLGVVGVHVAISMVVSLNAVVRCANVASGLGGVPRVRLTS